MEYDGGSDRENVPIATKTTDSVPTTMYNTLELTISERNNTIERPSYRTGERFTHDKRGDIPETRTNIKGEKNEKLSTVWNIVVVVLSLYTGMFSIGFGYSLGVLYAELVRVFDVGRASVAMIQSIHMAFCLAAAILWNKPFTRYGPGLCIIAGSSIFSLAILISAFSVNIEMLICFLGVIAGISGSVLNLGPYIIMGKVFKKKRNSVLAILTCGGSIGQIVLTFSIEKLISLYDWSGALLIVSGLALNMVPCCLLIHVKTRTVIGKKQHSDENNLLKPFLFKNWKFVLLLLASFIFSASVLAESKFLVDLTVIKGFDLETGSLFASLIGVTSLVGRSLGAGINMFNNTKSILLLSFFVLICGGAHVLILLSGDYYGLLLGALLSGLGLGLSVSQLVVIMLDIFPLEHFPAAIVMWNLVGGLGNVTGGYIGGIIPDLTGGYDMVFWISTAGCVLDTVIFLVVYIALCIERRRPGYTKL